MSGTDALRELWERYDGGEDGPYLSERDVYDELRRSGDYPASLAPAMREVAAELAEEAEWGGRGDSQAALDALIDALREEVIEATSAGHTGRPSPAGPGMGS